MKGKKIQALLNRYTKALRALNECECAGCQIFLEREIHRAHGFCQGTEIDTVPVPLIEKQTLETIHTQRKEERDNKKETLFLMP